VAASQPPGPLPGDFAEQLARLLAPGEGDAAGTVIATAAELDEEALADFLERLAARVRRSAAPITADEVRSLLPGDGPGRRAGDPG
jgi:hypothetical protein